MEIGNGISVFCRFMNYLNIIKEKIQKAERLHDAQLVATKKGRLTTYNSSVFKKRKTEINKEMSK